MLTKIYEYKGCSYNKKQKVSFKQKALSNNVKQISKELSAAITTLGIVLININTNSGDKKHFDHSKLAQDIISLLSENKNTNQICKELGISKGLYCNIVKEFNIQTKRKIQKQNRVNVDIENFIKDVNANLSRKEILDKYNITVAQYYYLMKINDVKSKRMQIKDSIKNITREEFIDAIKNSFSKIEVCERLGIKSLCTYDKLKEKFGILDDPIRKREKWENLTVEEKRTLLESNKSLEEIEDEYNITRGTFQVQRKIAGIKTPVMIARENKEKLDIENLQKEIDKNELSIEEIQKKYNISNAQFQTLIDEKLISTPQKRSRDKIANITAELLQKVINESSSTKEVIKKMNISKGSFYNLLRRYKITAPWLVKKESFMPVTKDELILVNKEKLTIAEICKKFNISEYIYYKLMQEYGLEQKVPSLSSKFKEVTPELLKEEIDKSDKQRDVYESLNMKRKQYRTLVLRAGIKTKHEESLRRASEITKELLIDSLLEGLSVKEIGDRYNLSPETIYLLLKQHSLDYKANGYKKRKSSLEKMNIQELKKTLVSLFVKDKNIGTNRVIGTAIDNVIKKNDLTDEDKKQLISFIRILQNINNKNIKIEEALAREEFERFLKI